MASSPWNRLVDQRLLTAEPVRDLPVVSAVEIRIDQLPIAIASGKRVVLMVDSAIPVPILIRDLGRIPRAPDEDGRDSDTQ